ncbi:otoferlin-like [Clytia hemisphaerica]|uniref:otoferlin-like n=1 Tax=Clytia hemisphaerica TaxID=252671 RepID=UPI0034D587FB
MSLAVFLKEVLNLRGNYDRVAKLTFRNVTKTTDVYQFCSDAFFEAEFDWELKEELEKTDFVQIQIFNYKPFMKNRLIAHYQVSCKKLKEEPWVPITDYLVDVNNTIIRSEISIELLYVDEFPRDKDVNSFEVFRPIEVKMRVLEDWELESRASKNSKFSLTSSLKRKLGSMAGSMTSSKRLALLESGELDEEGGGGGGGGKKKKKAKKEKERFNLHPKVRVRLKSQREELTFKVQIKLIEGRNLAGTQLDPIVDAYCFDEKKKSKPREQTNNPSWDEPIEFNAVCQRELAMDQILRFEVYSGRNLIKKGHLLGTFKIDLGTIYHQPDHRFIRKYACLSHPNETLGTSGAGIKGYLKLDLTVLAEGDLVKEAPALDDDDIDSNPLLPDGLPPERERNRLVISIYKAEGLPKMNSGMLAAVRKAFSGETRLRDLADPFVTITFAGQEASTKVIEKCYDPEWNEEITFCDLFPSLCRRIKVQLRDKDVTKIETVGTTWIDLSEISNNNANVHKYNDAINFPPTFGPTWVNLYGSTRDFSFIDKDQQLNEGMEEGIGYRGRILMYIKTTEGESASNDEICNINVKAAFPISDLAPGKEETFQLFCCIYEASMIHKANADKPCRFEMNIGNYGNTIDGKMISFKDDDDDNDDEEDEDPFVRPLTKEYDCESADKEYYHIPFGARKPTMGIRFPWEDHRRRCYLTNIMEKLKMKLEDELDDVRTLLSIDSQDTYLYLQDALKEFISYCDVISGNLSKITGAKAGVTLLDEKRRKLCEKETEVMQKQAKSILDELKDNKRIEKHYFKVLKILNRIDKIMIEPQNAIPDVFLWLMSGGKRKCYVRIPVNQLMYSPIEAESGKNAGRKQTYLLSLPGKAGYGEAGWAIHCKLTCLIWLGVMKNKNDMLIDAPEEFDVIPANSRKSTAPVPTQLKYLCKHKYILRAHLYQARGLIGSDDSGLSDAFARVVFNNQAAETRIIYETRNPTWNQMLILFDLTIWGDIDPVVENPPTIMIEIFDYDPGGEIEFIGRVMARPLVKKADSPYEGPLFPPKLEWFQIYRGDLPAGEMLAAFELFQVHPEEAELAAKMKQAQDEGQIYELTPEELEENKSNIPLEEAIQEIDEYEIVYFIVPLNIQPVMEMRTIEVLFWGVRELKPISFYKTVEKPQVFVDCVGKGVASPIIESVKKNPNFEEPYNKFELMLPIEDRYCPPLTFSVKEEHMFGNEFLIGTAIVKSLLRFQVPEEAYFQVITPVGGGGDAPPVAGSQAAKSASGCKGGGSKGGGIDNKGFEGDATGSKAGSKIGTKAVSKAASVIGSVVKSVTFVPEGMEELGSGHKTPSRKSILKTPSRAPSPAASQAGSFAGSRRGSLAPPSVAGSRVGSVAGSRALSVAGSQQQGSRKGSFAGSRAGSLIPGSKAGSIALSQRAGSLISGLNSRPPSRAGSRLQSLLATPSRQSIYSRTSQKIDILPTPAKMSLGTIEHSSTIHHHIVSNPGSSRRASISRRRSITSATSRLGSIKEKSPSIKASESVQATPRKKSFSGSEPVTPFKKLMSQKGSPEKTPLLSQEGGDVAEILDEELYPEDELFGGSQPASRARSATGSNKKSLIEQISTPIRSIGSKLATPLQSLKKSTSGSIAGDDPEDIELQMGAEASDFYDQSLPPLDETAEEEHAFDENGDPIPPDPEGIEGVEVEGGEGGEGAEGEAAEGETPAEGEAAADGAKGAEGGEGGGEGGEEDEEGEEESNKTPAIEYGLDELKALKEALKKEEQEDGDDEADPEEEEGDGDNEEQIDWWSRFYETIKDKKRVEEAIAKKTKKIKKEREKQGKKFDLEEEEQSGAFDGIEEDVMKKNLMINPKIVRIKIYNTELEDVECFSGFNDVLHSFVLLRGKSNGNDDDDERRIFGKFKGAIKVWKHPLPDFFKNPSLVLGSFQMLPTRDPLDVLCRVYIVRALNLTATDAGGSADPYIQLRIGKTVIKDVEGKIENNLNPTFGRKFDIQIKIPQDNMLTVSIYDMDTLSSTLIGETKIDVEDRFFSKHKATCGMHSKYHICGFNKWRDPIKPTAILRRLCKDHGLIGPTFKTQDDSKTCLIATEQERYKFHAEKYIVDESGNQKESEEPAALTALHYFHKIDTKGYALVPEHVETRKLFAPSAPGLEQTFTLVSEPFRNGTERNGTGRVQLWVDLFDMDGPSPDAAVDITPRKPTAFELRVIIWNTEDVELGDINILTGQPCADIYVKGWLEGLKHQAQQTDVHGSSLTGEGNFNWRFIFPFKYHKAEDKVVIIKKSLFTTTEEKMPGRLVLHCYDSDALSSDDFIGDITLQLNSCLKPTKTSKECKLETALENEDRFDIFKKKTMRGWWPFILDTEDEEPKVNGKVDAELQLLTAQESEERPAGKGRNDPDALPPPNRPDLAMEWMMNPLKAFRYFLWEQYKFCLAKFVVLAVIGAIMGLFFYSMPGFIVKKMFGA